MGVSTWGFLQEAALVICASWRLWMWKPTESWVKFSQEYDMDFMGDPSSF